jgi:hypothetical protein
LTPRTPSAHLDIGAAEWPHELVGPCALERMRQGARHFPPVVAGVFAECHLSHPERTDLVARVVAKDRNAVRDEWRCPTAYRDLLDRWCDPAHAAYLLPALDIEWDAGTEQPFVAPYFEPDLIRGHRAIEARRRDRASSGLGRLARDNGPAVLRALDPSIPERWYERLAECIEALPEYGVLIPGWSQLTRPGDGSRPAIRAIIALPRHALTSYLERLGWPGNVHEALVSIELLRPSSPWIGFDADIGAEGLGRRLGFYQEHQCVVRGDADIASTLSRLAARGLCDPARLSGLAAWVDRQPEQPDFGQGRSLSLKLVTGMGAAGEPPTVKAYVSSFDVPVVMRQSESAVVSVGG